MALVKGSNSYATVQEADIYFEDRLDVAAWTEADDEQKSKALVTATSYLDTLNWLGYVDDEAQKLRFPAVGTYFDPKFNRQMPLNPVPQRIIQATFELAYHFLNNDGLLDETGSVVDLQVSSIQLTRVVAPSKMPSFVKTIINPILQNSGNNKQWFRAN